ncbi:hypothetical protein PENSUB_9799 [Penicillium subrubescens]|uniref:Major facilitator superfamily (MFS) profile domain-containing protein n=1 Tax=Penicillium subrubescens TaxID=1316194 RepID=A0A1Q5TCB7_9EURO|nr:hypothetical protein PENSUB_9799 [Penicillium subrubescens]
MSEPPVIEVRNSQEQKSAITDIAEPKPTLSKKPDSPYAKIPDAQSPNATHPNATVQEFDRGYSRVSMVNELLMEVIYPQALTTAVAARLSNAFMVGMIIGLLSFGYIWDKLGRKTGAVLTTTILVLGIALSAGASGLTDDGMFWMLIIARGIAGVGSGGEYLVAGAGAAEATDEAPAVRKRRGFIFAMIGDLSASLVFAFGALVPLILLLCFHQQGRHYEAVWRVSLAMGAIAPLSIFWFRYQMVVSSAYRKSSMKKQPIPYLLAVKKYWRSLLGVCGSSSRQISRADQNWPISYNYISYPFGLFSSTIVGRVNPSSSLALTMAWGTLINCIYIPGAFIGGLLSDRIGRRRTMALGFSLQAILGFILGGALGPIQTKLPLFIVLDGICLTLASESFPTALRGHGVGLAAAWSKASAAIGTQVFKPILASWGDDELHGTQTVFLVGSGFAVLGSLLAWFVLEDSDRFLDHGDQDWKDYLTANGYTNIEWGIQDGPPMVDNKAIE